MPSERYEYYLDQCKIHHATRKTFSGKGCLKHWTRIVQIAREVGATSALDFGCGKQAQYATELPTGRRFADELGFMPALYDPAVPGVETLPDGPFDLVWCTDVLEHIPEEDIAWVLEQIGSRATKAVFLTVASYPAKKSLPDGSNAHVCLKPAAWWGTKFAVMRRKFPDLRIEAQNG